MAVRHLDRGFGLRRILPHTGLGWSSVGCAIAASAFYLLAMLAVAVGLETTDFAPAVVGPLALFALSGVAALIFGVVNVASGHDRSILVFLSAAVGLIVLGLVAWTFSTAFTSQPHVGPPGPPPSP